MRRDLLLHFIVWTFLMLILFKVPCGFGIAMGLGIIKEYGAFDWLYRLARQDHKESKDVDDIAADFCGIVVGFVIGTIVY